MEKLAHSFGLRRSTRSFAKLSSNPSPQPPSQQSSTSSRGNKENLCRQSMGPPAPGGGKSHISVNSGDCDQNGSKRAMLSTSSCGIDKNTSSHSQASTTSSSSKKANASWDRRLSVGIKRTISKLKLNSKSNKSSYLPVVDYPETEQPSPTTTSLSSIPMVGGRMKGSSVSSYDGGHTAMYRNGIGASLDQLNTLGASAGGRYYENQATNYQIEAPVSQPAQPRRNQQINSTQSSIIGAPSASPYIARAPRMGTSALRYSRDANTSSSRPSRLDQSFNAMLPVAEEQQDTVIGHGNENLNGNTDNSGFLWKAGWLSRYNLRSSRSRLSMSYADEPIVAGGGVDDSYMAEDLDDTRTNDGFNVSLVYGTNNQ